MFPCRVHSLLCGKHSVLARGRESRMGKIGALYGWGDEEEEVKVGILRILG